MFFSALFTCHPTLTSSLNHLIRSGQHVRRYRETDLVGNFQINDQLKFRWLFNRQVGGGSSFEDLVNKDRGAFEECCAIRSVGHEPAGFRKKSGGESRQSFLQGELSDLH